MAQIYLGFGSNVGNKRKFINGALSALSGGVKIQSASSFYRTEPWGNRDQPAFYNLCAKGTTTLSPKELLAFIKSVEAKLGRTHREKWGPREIDIDLLFYDSEIIKSPRLEVPHPHIAERAFVLVPLKEIAPDLVHPELKKTIAELSAVVDAGGAEKVDGI